MQLSTQRAIFLLAIGMLLQIPLVRADDKPLDLGGNPSQRLRRN
jgi:hypothetical protein